LLIQDNNDDDFVIAGDVKVINGLYRSIEEDKDNKIISKILDKKTKRILMNIR